VSDLNEKRDAVAEQIRKLTERRIFEVARPCVVIVDLDEPFLAMSLEEATNKLGEQRHVPHDAVRYFVDGFGMRGVWFIPHPDYGNQTGTDCYTPPPPPTRLQRALGRLPERLRWPLHNLVAHPVSEALWQVGLRRLSDRLHDATVPEHEEGTGRG
jgi:hypothetical protein